MINGFKFSMMFLILSFLSGAFSTDALAQEKNKLKKLLYIHDFDNINYDMLADADTTFAYLLDLGFEKRLSLVYEVNAECSMCIVQYVDFLKAYSKYLEADSTGKVPLYVVSKGKILNRVVWNVE